MVWASQVSQLWFQSSSGQQSSHCHWWEDTKSSSHQNTPQPHRQQMDWTVSPHANQGVGNSYCSVQWQVSGRGRRRGSPSGGPTHSVEIASIIIIGSYWLTPHFGYYLVWLFTSVGITHLYKPCTNNTSSLHFTKMIHPCNHVYPQPAI